MEVDRTVVKSRQPLREMNGADNQGQSVEEYLLSSVQAIIDEVHAHAHKRCDELRKEFERTIAEIRASNPDAAAAARGQRCVITITVTSGPHQGETFRLAAQGEEDELFRIGRSSGKNFKNKGVSLKKDKEVSTTHAKIETRGTKVFLTDQQSTNGTELNGQDVEPDEPMELHDGDVITMGKSELSVSISFEPIV